MSSWTDVPPGTIAFCLASVTVITARPSLGRWTSLACAALKSRSGRPLFAAALAVPLLALLLAWAGASVGLFTHAWGLVIEALAMAAGSLLVMACAAQRAEAVRQEAERARSDARAEPQSAPTDRAEQPVWEAPQPAEAQERAQTAFVTHMSHELRTPLHGILGLAELALDGEVEPERRALLESLHGSAKALLATVNDVLDFSKLEAGELVLQHVAFNPAVAVDEALTGLRATAAHKKLALTLSLSDDVAFTVLGDPERLRQIVGNLAGNAIKFTQSGSVTVRLERADADHDSPTMRLRLRVRDTGIGIASDKLRRILEPFGQADESLTRRFGGTGLGLAITERLVRAMGGELRATSVPERGSEFTVELPLELETTARSREPGAVGELPSYHVLIVEDNDVNVRVASGILQRAGHRVRTARNGREALDCRTAEPFDVVLMDVQMPVLDGLSATRQWRASEHGRAHRVPIVALTAHASASDQEQCLAAGMDSYLAKPIERGELLRSVRRWGAIGASRSKPAPPRTSLAAAPQPNRTPEGAPVPAQATASTPDAFPGKVLDGDAFLTRLEGDRALAKELLVLFDAHVPAQLDALRSAVAASDAEALESAAHSLKGVLNNIHAERAAQAAFQLERMARARDLQGLKPAFDAFMAETEQLQSALTSFRERLS